MKCPNCGLETMGTGGVCHVCGAPVPPPYSPKAGNNFSKVEYSPHAGDGFSQAEYNPNNAGNGSPPEADAVPAWAGNALPRVGHGGKRPIWKNNTVITASLVLLCAVMLAGIVALTRAGKASEHATPPAPAVSPGEPVDTNRYKVQQAIEAERARNGGADSGDSAVPASGNGGSSPSSGGGSSGNGGSSPSSGGGSSGNGGSSPSSGGGSSGNGGSSPSPGGNSSGNGDSSPSPGGSSSGNGYLLEGSDSRYVQRSELAGFTAEECRLARNEIYARHGRKFQDKTIQAYFNSLDWYRPTIEAGDFSEDMLNDYETANRNLIVKYEQEKGYR